MKPSITIGELAAERKRQEALATSAAPKTARTQPIGIDFIRCPTTWRRDPDRHHCIQIRLKRKTIWLSWYIAKRKFRHEIHNLGE